MLMANGATEGVLIKNFDTAKDVVASVLSSLPAEERAKYQLFEVKKGRDGGKLSSSHEEDVEFTYI